jgi:hypothetical protein
VILSPAKIQNVVLYQKQGEVEKVYIQIVYFAMEGTSRDWIPPQVAYQSAASVRSIVVITPEPEFFSGQPMIDSFLDQRRKPI